MRIRQNEAQEVLIGMLRHAGVPLEARCLTAADTRRAWEVFKAFASIPVEGLDPEQEQDGLLFSTGVYDWGKGPRFNFSCVRQFLPPDAEEPEQLQVCLYFQPTPDLAAVPAEHLWSFGLTRDDFFLQVERLPGFRAPLAREHVPTDMEVWQEPV